MSKSEILNLREIFALKCDKLNNFARINCRKWKSPFAKVISVRKNFRDFNLKVKIKNYRYTTAVALRTKLRRVSAFLYYVTILQK